TLSHEDATSIAKSIDLNVSVDGKGLSAGVSSDVTVNDSHSNGLKTTSTYDVKGKSGYAYVAPVIEYRWVKKDYYVQTNDLQIPKQYINSDWVFETRVTGFTVMVTTNGTQPVASNHPSDMQMVYGG